MNEKRLNGIYKMELIIGIVISIMLLLIIGGVVTRGNTGNPDYYMFLIGSIIALLLIIGCNYGVYMKKSIICAVILFVLSILCTFVLFGDKSARATRLPLIFLIIACCNFMGIRATLFEKKKANN